MGKIKFDLYTDCWGNERYYTEIEGKWYKLTFLQHLKGSGDSTIDTEEGKLKYGYINHRADKVQYDSVISSKDERLQSFTLKAIDTNQIAKVNRNEFCDLRRYDKTIYMFEEKPHSKESTFIY